jgi:hypothetical protein
LFPSSAFWYQHYLIPDPNQLVRPATENIAGSGCARIGAVCAFPTADGTFEVELQDSLTEVGWLPCSNSPICTMYPL